MSNRIAMTASHQLDAQTRPVAAQARTMSSHPLQRRIDGSPRQSLQRKQLTQLQGESAPPRANGLPSPLRAGIEALSGMDMGNVVVHRNSGKPAQLNAHAYAQGNEIHLGPGQEKHLPHEAWHVVQQAQGRVRPTMQMKEGVPVNDDVGLEGEADVMGSRALAVGCAGVAQRVKNTACRGDGDKAFFTKTGVYADRVAQRSVASDIDSAKNDISRTSGYSDRVLSGVEEYSEKIKSMDEGADPHSSIPAEVQGAAGGLKAWAGNYYNKAQAYLYEAQKANDHTNLYRDVWHLATLGQDTDTEPDIRTLAISSDGQHSSPRAIELKTCTTPAQENVASLVQNGLGQLEKRERTGRYSGLLLTVHVDHPDNIYPYTVMSGSLKEMFSDRSIVDNKLLERINATTRGVGITLPLEVRLEHEGKQYASVIYNFS